MKLIDRYIGRQIVFTALFAVAVLTLVLVLGNLFKLIDVLFNQSVPIEFVLAIIAYILPFSLTFTIPWGFLTAVLLVFGRLSAENELIALKSSGLSITRLCASLFFLAIFCVGICLWIDLVVAPRAQSNMKNVFVKIATQNPLALFDSDRVIDEFPGKKIYVEGKNGKELNNILVYEMDANSNVLRVIFAKKGELEATKEAVLLHIYDARLEQRNPDSPTDLDKIQPAVMKESVFAIPLKELYDRKRLQLGPAQEMPGELWREMKQLMAGPLDVASRIKLTNILTEINKRFSFSLASFALALIAVPLAITQHRKETSIGFLFSFIVAFGYFFFSQLANMAQNTPKLHPEFLVWLPNIVFIIFGSFLFRRLSRQ